MPQGIEVIADNGRYQFGSEVPGMKVVKRLRIEPTRIITSDTGNSTAPDYYLGNHWWDTAPIYSPDALIAVRPLDAGQDFYAHYYRGSRGWFNTPSRPTNATFSIFVSRPCEVFIYDYPDRIPLPSPMVGFAAWNEQGVRTFSSDGSHMRIARFMSGQLVQTSPGTPTSPPSYADAVVTLPSNQYMVCPLCKPYVLWKTDEYEQGPAIFADWTERNPWWRITPTEVRLLFKSGFHHGLNVNTYPDEIASPTYSALVLYANWEQNLPIG